MTFTYLMDYVKARTIKDRTFCESKRMIQAAFTWCKLIAKQRVSLWSAVPWHRFGQSADKSAHSKDAPITKLK